MGIERDPYRRKRSRLCNIYTLIVSVVLVVIIASLTVSPIGNKLGMPTFKQKEEIKDLHIDLAASNFEKVGLQ